MNCREIKQLWLSLPPDREKLPESAHGSEDPGVVEEMISKHLADCEACRNEYAQEQRWNQLISRRMVEVEVPSGLLERLKLALLEALQKDSDFPETGVLPEMRPTVETGRQSGETGLSRRRLLRWGTLAATGLAAVGGTLWYFRETWQDRGLVLADLAQQLTTPGFDWSGLPQYDAASPPLPSPKEMMIPNAVRLSKPRGLMNGAKSIAAVYTFSPANGRGKPGTQIILTVIDLQRTPVRILPAAASFEKAEFLYHHDLAVKIWGSASTAFCCFATSPGTDYLDDLLPRETIA